jgi:integrase
MPDKLSQIAAEALEPGERAYIRYDASLPGFGIRVTPGGAKSWVFDYRPGGGRRAPTRRLTLGRIDALPYAKARKAAEKFYHRTRLGEDPAGVRDSERAAPSLDAVIDRYMAEEITPAKKRRTTTLYAQYFRNHVSPALGRKPAAAVSYGDVAKLHRSIGAAGAEVTANRVVSLIGSLYNWAGKAGEVPRGTNPARDVSRFREQARTRYLSEDEITRLGQALTCGETEGFPLEIDSNKPTSKHVPKNGRARVSPYAAGAIRLLLLTGCRLNEVLTLRWDDVDFERALLMLSDSKTGARPVWLNAAALAVLEDLRQIRISDYVIAGDQADKPRSDLNRPWRQIVKQAGLEGVTLHSLRHTHASIGVGAGVGLPLVGALLGHKVASTTARYAHIDATPARRASETVGTTIAAALKGRPASNVVGIQIKRP